MVAMPTGQLDQLIENLRLLRRSARTYARAFVFVTAWRWLIVKPIFTAYARDQPAPLSDTPQKRRFLREAT